MQDAERPEQTPPPPSSTQRGWNLRAPTQDQPTHYRQLGTRRRFHLRSWRIESPRARSLTDSLPSIGDVVDVATCPWCPSWDFREPADRDAEANQSLPNDVPTPGTPPAFTTVAPGCCALRSSRERL